jgi:TPR repeat protein
MGLFSKMKLNSLLKKAKKLYQLRDSGGATDIKREIDILLQIARFYDKHLYDKKFPRADILALEYYRAAAILDDVQAQYICSERFFERGRFWSALAADTYGTDIHKKYAQENYNEAFNYIKQAEMGGYALAKRLHGLAYIHGWGVEKNTAAGFKQIIDSIEMEGAWDRAAKIFEELKLNSPEFFDALMEYKAAKK